MLARTKKSLVVKVFRTFNTTPRIEASHYDVLGVTPKATQNEIKSAYYKLSKLYHPDKSKDEESSKKFRAITEAYEVLGNINLKKMYDRGLLVSKDREMTHTDYKPEEEPIDPTLKFYKSHKVRNVVPSMDGKTPIFDFDTWSKNHYGSLLKKTQIDKEFTRKRKQNQRANVKSIKQELTIYAMFWLGTLFVALVVYGSNDYDKNNLQKRNNKEPQDGECLRKGSNG